MITQEQQEHIEKGFKIPIDADWIISLARESIMPSDEELKQMRSYQEFRVRHTYAESYQEVVLKRELPYDNGHNTVIYKKSERGWLFRRSSWENPLLFFPSPTESERSHTLVEIIDGDENFCREWDKWKRERPEIFPPTPNPTSSAK